MFKTAFLVTLLAISVMGCSPHTAADVAPGAASAFYRVENTHGRWWFVSPAGHRLFARGVHGVRFEGDRVKLGSSPYQIAALAKYGTSEAWAHAVGERLKSWGFNCIGANSDGTMYHQGLPFTVLLNFTPNNQGNPNLPDVFSQEWADHVRSVAQKYCTKLANDHDLIGYFTDNELHWAGDYRRKLNLVLAYLELPPTSPGYQQAKLYIEAHHLDPAHMKDYEVNDFQTQVAKQYFQVTHDMIRQYDPNHLILGCRFSRVAYDSVLKGMAGNVDVVSLNNYEATPPVDLIKHITEITQAPVMISEFSFRANDSGMTNKFGPGDPVATQEQRAEKYEQYTSTLFSLPNCVGFIWLKYADNPPQGSLYGEDNNYGLVRNDDTPWETLVAAVTKANQHLEEQTVQENH